MRRITVEIAEQTFDDLLEQARSEKRPVRNQASWLLEHAVKEQTRPARLNDQLLTEAAAAA